MTGFGAAEGQVGSLKVSVEVRSVNHRFFSPSIKLPGIFARWEGDVRETVRARIPRGHVTISARYEGLSASAARVDEAAFGQAVEQLRGLRERYGLGGDVDLATVLRVPGVVSSSADPVAPETPAELLAVVTEATDALARARAAEGRRLAEIINARLTLAEQTAERLRARAPERMAAHREKLSARLAEITGNIAIDEQRLAVELALIADRIDVGEELDRFRSHVTAFRETMVAASDEPVGKRLGFLLQEMLREANTTGSKASDAAMQQEVVALKEELERIREQVENVE